ncbi:MAG: DUF2304 domain-containing protein [Patescibacteria group bacterium]
MLIQFILIFFILLLVLRLIWQLKNKEISGWQFLSWLVIWFLAIIIIWYPQVTIFLAGQLGVGRGVDLVIYLSVILLFYLLFRLLLRIERVEKNITKITQELAVKKDQNHESD